MDIHISSDGVMRWQDRTARCALGRSGIRRQKREGDGVTPSGSFPISELLYRADRHIVSETRLVRREITPSDGWCDDPADPAYNQLVRLPYPGSHEKLWRDDPLYDLVCPIGYNMAPIVPGLGSAIFMHVAASDYQPTEGCVALSLRDLGRLLADLFPPVLIHIHCDSSGART